MDGNTESLIAVIGSPIAGNPAQFVLERALAALDVDFRVLSFEVPENRLGTALDGIEALRFHGALIDHSMARLTGQWLAQRKGPPSPNTPGSPAESPAAPPVDCLYRPVHRPDPPGGDQRHVVDKLHGIDQPHVADPFHGADLRGEWLRNTLLRHFTSRGRQAKRGLRLGTLPCRWTDLGLATRSELAPSDLAEAAKPALPAHPAAPHESRSNPDTPPADETDATFMVAMCDASPDPEQLESIDVVALTGNPDGPTKLDLADWPPNDASTLVVDLTVDGHTDLEAIERRGYHVLTWEECRINTLAEALRRWTGQEPDPELIRDAIEEYLAV